MLDADEHAFRVDVIGFERDGFRDAQAGAIAGHQSGAISEAGDVIEEREEFFLTEDDGKLEGAFGAREIFTGPGHFERGEIEKFQGADALVDGFRRQLAFVE